MLYSDLSRHRGSIEVICGSMFSGKTEELIRLLRRAQYAKQNILVFKPHIDDRYSKDHVASHNRLLMPSVQIHNASEIYHHLRADTNVVGVDEAQFFDEDIVEVVNDLEDRGLRVLVAGLDLNWRGEPFHPMPELMAIAESVRKLHAVCVVCGELGSRTQRLVDSSEDILVGSHQMYEARCRQCFDSFDGSQIDDEVTGQRSNKTGTSRRSYEAQLD